MVWIAEVRQYTDSLAAQNTDVETFIADSQEGAQRLAALWVLEDIVLGDFYLLRRGNLGEENRGVLLSRDWKQLWLWISKNLDRLYEGEYITPCVDIQIYEQEEAMAFDEKAFDKACDRIRDYFNPQEEQTS